MKMKFIKSICLLFVVFTVSCDSYFDIGDLVSEERLVMYCMPVAGQDTTVIQLSKSMPIGVSGLPAFGLSGAEVSFTVNGIGKEVCWSEAGEGCVPELCYYSICPIKAGDRVEVSATFKGLPTVKGVSVIPDSFPVDRIELICKSVEDMLMQTRVKFIDPAGTDDYFGIKMVCQEVLCETGEDGTVNEIQLRAIIPCGFDFDEEPVFNDRVGLDAAFNFDYDYYGHLYIWPDETINGREYTLRLNGAYLVPTEFSYTNWDGEEVTVKVYYRYKIYLYRLSAEFYRYLKSVNDNYNNQLGEIGLAPLRGSYTNITGGYGVVGGCQIFESPWLINPTMDEPVVWEMGSRE